MSTFLSEVTTVTNANNDVSILHALSGMHGTRCGGIITSAGSYCDLSCLLVDWFVCCCVY